VVFICLKIILFIARINWVPSPRELQCTTKANEFTCFVINMPRLTTQQRPRVWICLEYAWVHSTSQKNICKLKTVQNFAARIMTGSRKYDHITPALKKLKWLPVENILYLRDCVMTYKCMNKLAPDYLWLCQKFVTRSEISNRVTRQSKQLHKPLCRTTT
jgi:hypothetical protein